MNRTAQAGRTGWLMLVPLLAGAAVAVTLGVYGRLHEPTGVAVSLAGFSGPLPAKVWLATGALGFGLVQVVSALAIYRRLPGVVAVPGWTPAVHRWSGRLAFLFAVPVAVHCLYAVGLQTASLRGSVHSLLGCLFFGGFVVKMLGLRRPGLPGWVLPVLGGLLFTVLVGLWWTSSWWFFTTFGVEF